MASSAAAGQADIEAQTDKKLRRKVIALAAAGAIGGFLFGFDSSVVNGAVDAIQGTFGLTAAFTGFAVASALLGCAVGAYLAGRLADRLGRIPVMLIGAVLFLVSSIGSGLAFAAWDLTVWRLVGGLGIGIASVIAPAYISEIAPKAIRGSLASLQQLAITIGIFTALLSDALLANVAGGASETLFFGLAAWRWMFLVCAVPAIIYGLVALRLPESPRFLLMTNKKDKATKVLASITPKSQLDKAVADIEAGIREDAANADKGSLRGKRFGLLPIVWVGIILSMLQQLVGINVIFYYSTTLWSSVGFKESDSLTISVITSVTNVAVTFVAIFLVDKVGRRPILLFGSVGMAVALGSMTLAFSQAQLVDGKPSLEGAWGIIALVGANLFVVAFGASWGPLVWVLLGEIFPTRIRGRALGVAAAAQWLTNFAVTMTFPIISQDVSLTLAYGLYAAFAALSFFFVFFFIPETKGVALEETGSLSVVRGKRGLRV
ncbi:sugar porter family MFS transporter [Agreia sp. COWG]|uniref:sugar porter family MFS transporter n=1 Tax=Agreia sp. COWG TaxID=2773266 RepID=UPI001926358B|nr:sugar porter family MFS transporter [Agreia sp. COWG]CAD5995605.1 Glucose transport protein [Agreia sp. COWG]